MASESLVPLRPGLEDVPVAESAISYIDGKRARLEYRGIAVDTLAKLSNFEETTWLLLKGSLPSQKDLVAFDQALRAHRKLNYKFIDMLKGFPESGSMMGALQSAVAALGLFYPQKNVADPAANWEATLRIVAGLPTIVAARYRLRQGDEVIAPRDDLDHAGNFFWMLFGREPSPATRKVIDACLILHAEHTMNASTFSCRVTASTLADPYMVIAAAIGTLAGPLHGGANEEVPAMLESIGAPANAQNWLEDAIKHKRKIMGFGHRVYRIKDPRATVLQDLAENLFAETGRPAIYETALELERVAVGLLGPKGIYPNVDFYSGIVYQALGLPIDVFTPVFAVSRASGWLAHWHEQLKNNRIFRPEQIYIGPRDLDYVPMDQRV
jgi:citrate synthase